YQHAARSVAAQASNPNPARGAGVKAVHNRLIAALTAEAGIWLKKHDADSAIAIYNRAVLVEQNRAGTYALRAKAYMAKGDNKQAMNDIVRALKFSWRPGFLKTRGKLRLEAGDFAGTIHDADAILKLDADDAAAFALRGPALVRQKQYAKALPDLDRAIKADDHNVAALSARGEVYAARHDDTRALADFDRAIDAGARIRRSSAAAPPFTRPKARPARPSPI
ncbi:MAG TPA: hypothetical protein VE224_15430, partial [Pseudolabrys sp.]|nr:hypothetical protein [Pseudolabrys sp.]